MIDDEESLESPAQAETPTNRGTKRNAASLSEVDESFFKRMDYLCANVNNTNKSISPTDHFCMRLAEGLHKLPRNIKNRLEVEFLQKVCEAEELYCDDA